VVSFGQFAQARPLSDEAVDAYPGAGAESAAVSEPIRIIRTADCAQCTIAGSNCGSPGRFRIRALSLASECLGAEVNAITARTDTVISHAVLFAALGYPPPPSMRTLRGSMEAVSGWTGPATVARGISR
jgi:hypothetical protein